MFGRNKPVKIVRVKPGTFRSAKSKTEKKAKNLAKDGYKLQSTSRRGITRRKREAVFRKD